MGGKNPAIVMDDAENLDRVAAHIVNGAFWNMGENCSASSRLIVHKDVKAELLERIAHHAKQWNIGDPLDPETRMGALVSEGHYNKVCGYLDQAENVVIGGNANKGFCRSDRGRSSRQSQHSGARRDFWPRSVGDRSVWL